MSKPTSEQVTKWAQEAGFTVRDGVIKVVHSNGSWVAVNERIAELAALAYAAGQTAEREACAAQRQQQIKPAAQNWQSELLDWVSACQSAYHIDNTAGHRFGGIGSNLEDNRSCVVEFVFDLLHEIAAKEREACAKTCEGFADGTSAYEVHHRFAAYKCADLIRKRGEDENIS